MGKICHERRLIGEVLLERGLITQAQLEKALELQRVEAGAYLGDILIRLGHIDEIEIVIALVVQCNLPYISLAKHAVDRDIAGLIPADFARRNRLVPLDRIGNVLSVVMHNPCNDDLRAEVESLTGCYIATFISTRAEIDQAIDRLYPAS